MRIMMALPLAAAVALAACSGSGDANGDGKVSASEAASAASKLDTPRPGKYKTTVELIDFTMPGMPAAMLAQMKGSMASNMDVTYCQKAVDREKSIKEMTDNMGRGDCTYNSFNVSGNSFNADMSCNDPQGGKGNYKMAGKISSTGSDVTMEITQNMPQGSGPMHMKSHVVSTRIGECDS